MPLEEDGSNATGAELPFIVGVMDDLSGNAPTKEREELYNRRFEKVTRHTIDKKIAEIGPGLEYNVKSTLPKSMYADDSMNVRLTFSDMKDFEPKRVAEKLPQLAKLLRLREQLVSLKNYAGRDPKLRKELEALIAELVPSGR
jgi:type VI secretion system protein ImpB